MIVEYIRYRVPDPGEFEAAYQRAVVPLGKSPWCLDYELSKCTEAADAYILRIVWTSEEDHMQGFRRSEFFGEFFTEIRPYVSDIEEMRHYRPVITKA
ncbi:antibiotic biosynthesis monooxygenase family protein [Streptosporangium sandarakinum]|uniref:Quinol monooxygenase YgiN n=1 Tax=Streptosporangium sandarakinum TaxID=1260955 RepID=A0A852UZU1_9ACTN|nr:antibiotic biosynthesis monooxygenase family protein [Streptosporangium sandarakinum]NYF41430.1 quinol monooxygenase YgiN [Streptosporangium sandarakinum]